MEIQELKNLIKSRELSDWYVLAGEEDYLKKYYLKEIRKAIVEDETFEVFNHAVFDGPSIDFSALREAIISPPMMSELKLVEWKYANINAMKSSEITALCELMRLKSECPYTVFVIMPSADGFDAGTPKKPSRLYTALSEGFKIITLNKSGNSQLASWIKKHFDAEGVYVDMPLINALIFRVGHSMEILNNEIIKLSSYAKQNGRSALSIEDVNEVSSPNIESDAFALSNAITEKNAKAAFVALNDLKSRKVEPNVIISMLEKTYCDLISVSLMLSEGKSADDIARIFKYHSYKVELYVAGCKKTSAKKLSDSLSKLRHLDAVSKSGGLNGYTPIEIFITQNV